MVLKYYAHPVTKKEEVWRDLSAEKITGWEIYPESRLGYKGGNLVVNFDINYSPLKKEQVENRGGVYPPISDILNYNEVLEYLKKNFSHLECSEDKLISPPDTSTTDTVKKENKITFGTRLRKLFN